MVQMTRQNVDKMTGEELMARWRKMTPGDITNAVEEYRTSAGINRVQNDHYYEVGCTYYFDTSDYSQGKKSTAGYKFCCEMLNYCMWYNQSWFHWLMGVIAFLVLVTCICISVCCCCCNGRNSSGKDVEEESEKEKIEK
ncbi:hypothetical protein GCK72_007763 [Caenorhabditis remanei]|uniref:Uncharacterized protein n=1 Tax=Caenorhabditis remanei TaxID=31234 RepID=A0A6A5HMH7_CAERE|nr:hypothetical protein GCK72_007763 [Caenorhabditis remanei]KAF1767804.1 hypothetical protein GCK72_007763 [Caenorhabditis remanei]